jgi:hypothetical protein
MSGQCATCGGTGSVGRRGWLIDVINGIPCGDCGGTGYRRDWWEDLDPMDVYFEFRLAFVAWPGVRIRTVDRRQRDDRPGYAGGRFVTPGAPAVDVKLTEPGWFETTVTLPAQLVDRKMRPVHDSLREWAESEAERWTRLAVAAAN